MLSNTHAHAEPMSSAASSEEETGLLSISLPDNSENKSLRQRKAVCLKVGSFLPTGWSDYPDWCHASLCEEGGKTAADAS